MKELVQKKDWDYSIYNVNGKKSLVWFFTTSIPQHFFL